MADKSHTPGKLIATYARVSTSNQEDQKTIEAQLLEVHKFAKEKGYTIVREYRDEGWSGDILARPGLDDLRMDAKKHTWEAVLIYDPDRLGRKYFYQELVMDELQKLGIETLFVTVPPVKDLNDRLLGGMRGLFAEYEKAKIAERFRIGKISRVSMGNILLSEAPYGYTYIPNTGKRGSVDYVVGHIRVNELEAAIVKDIFTWVADEGLTLRAVVMRLKERQMAPRKSRRGVWNTSTLTTLLRNKTYIGVAHWGASYAVVPENPLKDQKYKKITKTSRKMKPESEWSSIAVEPILDNDLFERAQEQMRNHSVFQKRNAKNEYLLSGKIRCLCGRTRTGEGPLKGKHLYYRCSSRVSSFPLASTCDEGGINARIADSLVWDKVSNLMSSPQLLLKEVTHWEESQGKASAAPEVNIEDSRKALSKLAIELDRYNKAYGEGVFTLEQLRESTTPIKTKIAVLESQLALNLRHSKAVESRNIPSTFDINSFTVTAKTKLENLSFASKKAIVIDIIDKVIATREQLQVSGFIPISTNHVEYKTISRHHRTSERRQIDAFQCAHKKRGGDCELPILHH